MSTKITDFTTKEPARHKGFRHIITEDQSIIDLAFEEAAKKALLEEIVEGRARGAYTIDEMVDEMEKRVRRVFPNEEYKVAELHMALLARLIDRIVIDRGVPREDLMGFLLDTIEEVCDE